MEACLRLPSFLNITLSGGDLGLVFKRKIGFLSTKFFLKKFVHSCQIYQNVHALILFILTHTYLKSVEPFKSWDSFFKDSQNLWFLFWEQKILYFWVQKQIIWLLTWKEDKFCTNMLEIFHWYMYLLGKLVLNIFRATFWNANSVQRLLTYPNTWSLVLLFNQTRLHSTPTHPYFNSCLS